VVLLHGQILAWEVPSFRERFRIPTGFGSIHSMVVTKAHIVIGMACV
jgi:hypothetical protein